MNSSVRRVIFIAFGILWMFVCSLAQATDYYISPSGSGTSCTITSPCSLATALGGSSAPRAGDTIYARGGTYTITNIAYIGKSGTSGNPIRLFNYPGETPVFNGSTWTPPNPGHSIIRGDNISWWHFKGLEFAYSPGSAIRFGGTTSGITIELCNIHHNVRLDANGAGIEVGGSASNYLILNNDIHRQSINQPSGTGGDGLGFYGVQQSGNIIRGNRIWRNHDDGVDLWDSANILLENNWSWENGYNDNLSATSGNGVGYKLGGTGSGDGNHTLRNNLAWNNLTHGFDNNSADRPIFFFNNTGYKNVWNFVVASGSPNAAHQLKNNLSYLGNAASTTSLTIQTTNSWNTITPSAGTFVSLDFTANLGARKSDGSLPDSNFLKLNPSASSGNNAVDRGTNIGFSFDGSAPDLGAYEFTNSPASLAAPSNLLVQP